MGGPDIRERWFAFRDRMLTRPSFQRLATAFPLTRPIARRSARALFDLCAGFVYSQTLLACVRLRLFDVLAEGPQSVDALARRLALPPESAARLLEAAASLDLVARRRGERYGLGSLGAALLGNPGLQPMIEHHALLYADLADPVGLLRGEQDTALSAFWPYAGTEQPSALSSDQVARYSALMAASQSFIAHEALATFPLGGRRCLLDVGGGEGVFLSAAAKRFPDLALMLFDLPAVADRARARFADEGIAQRASAIGGSFLADPLPRGADTVSLLRVLHDHDDATALTILRAIAAALPPGGIVLVAEPMAGTAGAEPVAAYFTFYFLAMGRGRLRTAGELSSLLRSAGLQSPRPLKTRNTLVIRALVADAPGR
jgi:demethylspheroidene O-methyltransferase